LLGQLDQKVEVRLPTLDDVLPHRSVFHRLDGQAEVCCNLGTEVGKSHLDVRSNRLAFAKTVQTVVTSDADFPLVVRPIRVLDCRDLADE
jgi:hypothetical protein